MKRTTTKKDTTEIFLSAHIFDSSHHVSMCDSVKSLVTKQAATVIET